MPPQDRGVLPRGAFALNSFILSTEEYVTAASGASGPTGGVLSPQDRVMAHFGHIGQHVCLEQTVLPLLFRQALSHTLDAFPWLAGRLYWNQTGQLDIDCCNKGALLGVASTATTLEQLMVATQPDPETGAMANLLNPWQHKLMSGPEGPMVAQQCPLVVALVTQLSGGGSLLMVAVHHVLCDTHSIQLLVAHCCSAYNQLLDQRQAQHPHQQAPPPVSAGQCGNGAEPAVMDGMGSAQAHGLSSASGAAAAAAAERLAAQQPAHAPAAGCNGNGNGAAAAPSSLCPIVDCRWAKPYEDAAAASNAGVEFEPLYMLRGRAFVARVMYNMFHHVLWRGGGLQQCVIHVPAARLAELKRQANQELAAALAESGARDAAANAAGSPQWLSTNDALGARVLQVLHSLPNRRGQPMQALLVMNMRARLSPPLPTHHLHNVAQSFLVRLPVQEGSLAGIGSVIRDVIEREAAPCFQTNLAHVRQLQEGHGSLLAGAVAFSPDPRVTQYSPEGTVVLNQWRINHQAYAFGGRLPLRFFNVLAPEVPNLVLVRPEADGSINITVSLHTRTWRLLAAGHGGLRI